MKDRQGNELHTPAADFRNGKINIDEDYMSEFDKQFILAPELDQKQIEVQNRVLNRAHKQANRLGIKNCDFIFFAAAPNKGDDVSFEKTFKEIEKININTPEKVLFSFQCHLKVVHDGQVIKNFFAITKIEMMREDQDDG